MRKKLFTFLLALVTSVGMSYAAPDASGSCGANVTYSFNGATGAMTITGTGPMTDYASISAVPWDSYRDDITSVTITDGVTSVGSYSFEYHENLVTVTIGNNVETIGAYAFGDCSKLTTLNLGNSVRHIGDRAFMWAKVLTGFTLPSTLETIGDRAFLQNKLITSLTIPSNVTSIGQSAFMYCAALTSITVEATTPPTLGATVFEGVPTSIPLNVPNGSVDAYEAAAQWTEFDIQGYGPAPTPANVCGDGLTWELNGGVLTISYDGVGTGEMYDFGYEYDQNPVNVAPWKENKSAITTVIVGDGVKSIGNYAFNDLYENFTAVTIANSVERIGVFAFTNAKWITEITLPSSLKTIDRQCFSANFGITSITIPSGVTSIGYQAFSYCSGLTSLTCEATTPPTLASGVFSKIRPNAASISSIPLYVPSGSVAAYEAAAQWNAFDVQGYDPTPHPHGECGAQGDNLLWEFNPATGTLTITGSGAMPTIWDTPASVSWHEYRADITSVSLPDGLTTIGGYAFYSCPGLTSVTIPENVTNIAIAAFANCANLASVTLPNSVISIGQSALALCPSMTSLTLGSGLSSIGTAAFSGCSGLESVTNYATTPQVLDSYAFYNVEISNCELYVPEESVDAYQAATTWKDFKNVQAIGPAPTPTDEHITANEDPKNTGVYYSTFFDSANKYALPAGVEAYVAEVSSNALNLTKIAGEGQTIPANNAVILKSNVDQFTLSISNAAPVSFTATNNLHGVDADTEITSVVSGTCYVLSGNSTDGVGFFVYKAPNQLQAHKAYIDLNGSGMAQAPKRMPFVFNGEQTATGVDNAQGDKVQSTKVIENGVLFIIKNGVKYNAMGQIVK